ncbi:MAG: ubiquinone/menaquinone biosynthesis methyltransferase [Desulfovibrio sp.]|nr:ubiquinone/menaquinone biosynthesis methyltransferase [Desulfovibrio sp.]
MFAHIAGVYDFLNHTLSFGVDRSWRRKLAASAPSTGPLLDLAAGTLDVALALHKARPDARIIAADFCAPMLQRGLRKLASPALEAAILPCAANALALPLAAGSMAGITIAFGIRNIRPRKEAFLEMLRILKPGGRACILEFGSASEKIWGGIYNLYLAALLPAIGRLIARDREAYAYLARTIREFPTAPELAAEMEDAGFGNVGFRKLTGGIVCLHWGEKPTAQNAAATRQ